MIVDLAPVPYVLRLREPVVTARGAWQERRGFWVVLLDEQGGHGIGEVAPLPGFGTETEEEAAAALDRLRGERRADPHPQKIEKTLESWDVTRERTPALCAGLELALLDWAGRCAGLPIAEILATAPCREVPVNALLASGDPGALASAAAAAIAAGYGTLKVKVGGRAIEEDVRRLEAVRRAAGGAVSARLRADANGSWSVDEARAACHRLAGLDLEYIEDPVATAEDLDALRAGWAGGQPPVPIAADALASTPGRARALLRSHAIDVLVLKPAVLGGIRLAERLALDAIAAGLRVVVTSALDSAVGTAGALHLACALPPSSDTERPVAHGLATAGLFEEMPAEGLPAPADGRMRLPDGAGHGVRLPFAFPW
ncbi:MAG: o-succinylbenzoate synthase [Candidatus Eisenbacteria bacterium]